MKFVLMSSVMLAAIPCVAAAAAPPAAESAECSALAKADFSQVPEAPTQILQVTRVEAASGVPAFCDVHGVVAPNVGFQLKLPTSWNGRFFQAGCGNYCGILYPKACDDPLRKGYACIVNDAGHVARPSDVNWTDGQWAFNNLQTELDYGGRASHVTAVAGKAVTENYYRKAPAKSYFMGCSYGGHQAMVLAQRYPWDFDGIVGGGAPYSLSILMQQNLWALSNAYDANVQPVFSEADIGVLHDAALAKCDLDDGIKDGLIGNPAACPVDPDALVCKGGNTANCLSRAKADAAKRMYSGPVNSKGEQISSGGWVPGSELFWRKVYRPDGTGLAALARNFFRYMARIPDLGPGWAPASYDFDRDYKRNDVMETLYMANNPDLRRFKAAGGKFIKYVGWYDLGTLPAEAIDYYETSQKTMGGHEEMQEFFRMFMIPGALHCRGGEGAENIDFLSYIEAWVEGKEAPDVMIGSHKDASGNVAFTRPVYPYPRQAKYKGAGDPNKAENFESVSSP
jgi:feruloyl esterase